MTKDQLMGRVKAMEAAGVPKAEIDKYIKAAAAELNASGALIGAQPVPTVTPKTPLSQALEPPYVPPKPGLLTQALDAVKKSQTAYDSGTSVMRSKSNIVTDTIESARTGVTAPSVQKVADFGRKIGLGGVGDLIGRDIFDTNQSLHSWYEKDRIPKETQEWIAGGKTGVRGMLTKEFIGSAIQTANLVATAGAPLNPHTWGKEGIKLATKEGAKRQAISAIGQEIENDQSLKHMLVAVPARAALGSIFEVLSFGLSRVVDHALTKSPTGLVKGTLHQIDADRELEAAGKIPDLAAQVEKMKWIHTTATLNEGAVGGVKASTDAVNGMVDDLARGGTTVDGREFIKRVTAKEFQIADAEGMASVKAEAVRKYLQNKLDDWTNMGYDVTKLPIDVVHKFIKSTYATLGDAAAPAVAADMSMNAVKRVGAGAMREALGKASPELDAAIFEQQFWIRLAGATMKDFVKDPAKIQQMTDVLLAGDVIMSRPGAGTFIGFVMKAVKSHLGARAAAVWLDGVNEVVKTLPTEAMQHAADAAFMALYNYTGNAITAPAKVDDAKRKKAEEWLKTHPAPPSFRSRSTTPETR